MALSSWMKSRLEQIRKIDHVLTSANTVLRLRPSIEKTERRGLQPGHRQYHTCCHLCAITESFNRHLKTTQSVHGRFGSPGIKRHGAFPVAPLRELPIITCSSMLGRSHYLLEKVCLNSTLWMGWVKKHWFQKARCSLEIVNYDHVKG